MPHEPNLNGSVQRVIANNNVEQMEAVEVSAVKDAKHRQTKDHEVVDRAHRERRHSASP
jgi:hypothetical protein